MPRETEGGIDNNNILVDAGTRLAAVPVRDGVSMRPDGQRAEGQAADLEVGRLAGIEPHPPAATGPTVPTPTMAVRPKPTVKSRTTPAQQGEEAAEKDAGGDKVPGPRVLPGSSPLVHDEIEQVQDRALSRAELRQQLDRQSLAERAEREDLLGRLKQGGTGSSSMK